jgi:hypothetical protein
MGIVYGRLNKGNQYYEASFHGNFMSWAQLLSIYNIIVQRGWLCLHLKDPVELCKIQ